MAKHPESEIRELYADYSRTFKKYRIKNADTLVTLNRDYVIECTKYRYERENENSEEWVVVESSTSIIDGWNYGCCISSIPVFGDEVKSTYIRDIGTIPTRLTSVSWGIATSKAVREFRFYKREEN